ncbi:RNA polymerase sigma-70 factor (ECF subfamily) [Pseudarthrobacter sp. PvP004]|uniref:RNA polymerase sigma factor n=1 Tax=Pseudarthrobacter sp. PvP004 TaxID=2817850 RepID=UPI001AE3FB81|nr:RNA polymerase sigma factor [Pseudarthrobacter sp. PvP004]MBP2269299.1 RNA polymerase sigma-70 factor (ECF subfamily) [Pseudarthrobacter sp. PvP004]
MLLEREAEFEALYRAHYRRVYHYILRRIGDPETAQELTDDVFWIAWRKFNDQNDAGLPWLCAVAHNLLGNEFRGRKRRRELMVKLREFARMRAAGQETPVDGSRPGAEPASDPVMETLGRLPEHHREVLILVYWDNFTTAELARCLGCTEGTAGVRLHRAKKAFAEAAARTAQSAGS